VLEAELVCTIVHLLDEGLARSRDVLGEVHRRVVRALEQERLEQVLDLHPLALAQVDSRLGGRGVVRRRREDIVRVGLLEREEGGH